MDGLGEDKQTKFLFWPSFLSVYLSVNLSAQPQLPRFAFKSIFSIFKSIFSEEELLHYPWRRR